jgi:hypothetical protein
VNSVPSSYKMTVNETIPLALDMTESLPQGDSVVAVASTALIEQQSGVTVATPTHGISGNVVTATIVGSTMTAGRQYTLSVVFTAGTSPVYTLELDVTIIAVDTI